VARLDRVRWTTIFYTRRSILWVMLAVKPDCPRVDIRYGKTVNKLFKICTGDEEIFM
jgi:hypothetical protein